MISAGLSILPVSLGVACICLDVLSCALVPQCFHFTKKKKKQQPRIDSY